MPKRVTGAQLTKLCRKIKKKLQSYDEKVSHVHIAYQYGDNPKIEINAFAEPMVDPMIMYFTRYGNDHCLSSALQDFWKTYERQKKAA